MLIVFGGLPGTGKTTLARSIARERLAVYLRIDTIERALLASEVTPSEIGPIGYDVAYALAEENLRLDRDVVADSVNPLPVTRDAWRRVAQRACTQIVEIEVVCSNPLEHRRRIETRFADGIDRRPLTWQNVIDREYEPYDRSHIVIDTWCPVAEALEAVRSQIVASTSSSLP